MRIALLVHGLPPEHCTGVEVHALALARGLARRGHVVECFAQVRDLGRAHLSQERRVVAERLAITRLATNVLADDERGRRIVPGAAEAFARFLDRERPELLHVEHALGTGPAGLRAAHERGIPVVLQAHDPLAISLDHLLLRTDGMPLALGDDGRPSAADLARNALGRACLERHLDPGAHGSVVLPQWLDTKLASELSEVLDGELDAQRAEEHERLARELASETDEWREAFAGVDALCASSAGLAEMLRSGDVRVDRVVPCGIELEGLDAVRAERAPTNDPVRFGVLGGLRPHKGAQVALEAFALLRADGATNATLALRGEGEGLETRALADRAAELGADCTGGFRPAELPRLLAALDVLLVPSIWPENAPFVIREAFAAGIPVIASEIGALPESLADGGGVLVPPGDPAALAAAMRELIEDGAALAELRASVPVPLAIDEECAQWEVVYAPLVADAQAARHARRNALPAHLHDFADRTQALNDAPLRELIARGFDGIERLAARLQPGRRPTVGVGFASALEAVDGPRETLADATRRAVWSDSVADHRGGETRHLRDALEWREGVIGERDAQLSATERERDWKDEQLAAQRAAAESAAAACDDAERGRAAEHERAEWLAERTGVLESEAAWLRDQESHSREAAEAESRAHAARAEERDWLRDCVTDREAHLESAQAALGDLRSELEALTAERDWLKGRADEDQRRATESVAHASELAEQLDHAARDNAARADHQSFLLGELSAFASALGVDLEQQADWSSSLAAARDELTRRATELGWRAEEMSRATGEASRGLARRLGAAALRRARGWTDGGPS